MNYGKQFTLAELLSACTYFDTLADREELTHEGIGAALLHHFGGLRMTKAALPEAIKAAAPLKVAGWARMGPSASEWADELICHLRDTFSDSELCNPDDGDDGLTEAELDTLQPLALALAEAYLAKVRICGCDLIGHAELDAEQIEQILRQEAPEWFESAQALPA